ncbi:MAG: DUF305 domain-containing protein [Acidobacteriota bacterium]|nr:DUF305 domain-containing protein [Acidobacteriota bacterium]MDQ5870684.1 DUF305 domain-containing protein [Acidobacteriota bacterium]
MSATTPAPEAEAAAPGATAAAYDLQFLDGMSKHHQTAVEMAKMGQGKFAHAELGALAKNIVVMQESEIAQMTQWRGQWFPGSAASGNMEMPGMESSKSMDMSHMQSMSGKELDLMFIDMMIPHHQSAIAMSQDALAKAEHPEIKELAQKIISDQQKEIDQMQQWKSRWNTGK